MTVTIRSLTEGITFRKLKAGTNITARHGLSSDEARHRLTLGSNVIAERAAVQV